MDKREINIEMQGILCLIASFFIFVCIFSYEKMCTFAYNNKCDILFLEYFSGGMENWWLEGGEKVWIEDDRLYMNADPKNGANYVCTVWCKREFPDSIQVEFDAHVISSSINANNYLYLQVAAKHYLAHLRF